MLPPRDDPRKQWVRQSLFKYQSGEVSSGHACDGVDKGELLLRCEGGYGPATEETAALGHLTGRPGGSQDLPVSAFQCK